MYEKNLPQQTKAVIGNQWSQVRDDDQASNLFNVDKAGVFLDTWMAQRKEEEPSFFVCEQCKLSGGRLVVGVRQSRSKATDNSMSGWWRGDCGQPYDWEQPNFMFTLQIATAKEQVDFAACAAPDGECDNLAFAFKICHEFEEMKDVGVFRQSLAGSSNTILSEALIFVLIAGHYKWSYFVHRWSLWVSWRSRVRS